MIIDTVQKTPDSNLMTTPYSRENRITDLAISSLNLSLSLKNLVSYKAEHVNSLLHIDDSKELELDEKAIECGDILIKHQVNDFIAISRLHYHYKLNENETVVLSVEDSSKSRLKNSYTTDRPIIFKKPELADEKNIPYIFRFAEDGSVIPLEYISGDLKNTALVEKIKKQLKDVLNNKDFLSDLFSRLVNQNNREKLGFQISFEKELIGQGEEGEEIHEDNWYRHQEVSYRKLEAEKATVTSWRFETKLGENRCYCRNRVYCYNGGNGHMRISDGHNQYD
jgi:hypothetical protein